MSFDNINVRNVIMQNIKNLMVYLNISTKFIDNLDFHLKPVLVVSTIRTVRKPSAMVLKINH